MACKYIKSTKKKKINKKKCLYIYSSVYMYEYIYKKQYMYIYNNPLYFPTLHLFVAYDKTCLFWMINLTIVNSIYILVFMYLCVHVLGYTYVCVCVLFRYMWSGCYYSYFNPTVAHQLYYIDHIHQEHSCHLQLYIWDVWDINMK